MDKIIFSIIKSLLRRITFVIFWPSSNINNAIYSFRNYNETEKIFTEGDFPHRIMETGQKYHGSNGLVRDEFSSPFHWETQSQMETFYTMDKIEIPGMRLLRP